MAVKIATKTGSWWEVDAFYEDVVAAWKSGVPPVLEYDRLDGGIPRPKIAIETASIESVQQIRR